MVVTYGQLEKDGVQYLVPLTISTLVEPQNYWCRGLFTDYEMFGVKHRIVVTNEHAQMQDSESLHDDSLLPTTNLPQNPTREDQTRASVERASDAAKGFH